MHSPASLNRPPALQPAFPAGLDPCLLLGAWGALCSFLLTTLWLAVAERRASSE